jgi:hypothetical protein
VAIQGRVMGGQSPITGANVYLFAANTAGYGGAGIAASSNNKSVSLLNNIPGTTTLDTSGGATNGDYYVTSSVVTGSCPLGGCFSITGDYTCTPGAQVYLYALGGSQGSIANPAAGLLAVLGNCPPADNFATATPYVVMNEVSTIAAAYALAGFATDAVHVSSSGSKLALPGIANAFANAANLETLSTGVALATTPAGNGTAPQTTINTLANILGACVNSNGAVTGPTSPTACYTLFNDALSGGSSGTLPGDTATAAINMAHYPGTNITGLYGLSTASPPFAPALNAQPNDFSVQLVFSGGGLAGHSANSIAIDGAGDAWIGGGPVNAAGPGLAIELSPLGAAISPSGGYTGGGLSSSTGGAGAVAIDTLGNAWFATNFSITKVSSTGTPSSGFSGVGLGGSEDYAVSLAIDASGDVWVADANGSSVSEFSSSGSPIGKYTGGGQAPSGDPPGGIAIDGSGNVWVVNDNGPSSVAELSNSGAAISTSAGYIGGGIYNSFAEGIALDSSGDAWIANQQQFFSMFPSNVAELSNSGTAVSPTNGYVGSSLNPASIAIDGSGNVWTESGEGLAELSNSGVVLSPATNGYVVGSGSVIGTPGGGTIAIDGSGDAWTVVQSGTYPSYVYNAVELIGVATPVITPICAGLPTTPTMNGTSNLGTRP